MNNPRNVEILEVQFPTFGRYKFSPVTSYYLLHSPLLNFSRLSQLSWDREITNCLKKLWVLNDSGLGEWITEYESLSLWLAALFPAAAREPPAASVPGCACHCGLYLLLIIIGTKPWTWRLLIISRCLTLVIIVWIVTYSFVFADAHTARIANVLRCCCFAKCTVAQCINSWYVFLRFHSVFFPQLASTPVWIHRSLTKF